MTSLLYYSISSGLSEDELVRIDDEVRKNREAFCIFARNIPSNVKGKTKRLIIVISLATAVYFSGLEPVEAIGINIPPQQTVVMSNQDNVIMNFQKQPKIMMKSLSKPGQISLPVSIYLIDERFLRTPEVSKLIKTV